MATRVALFVTCIVDQLFPRVGLAVADLLERAGCRVDFPEEQTCCGQPAYNSGYQEDARKVACHFLDVFRDYEYVVIPSGSCCSMITHHYEDLFAKDEQRLEQTRALIPRIHEFSKFLTDVMGQDDFGARFPHTVTFHDSCHGLRELSIKQGPRRLLANVEGLTLKEMDAAEECCGFGGTFAVKFPGVSGGMARTKIQSIQRTGAEYVVSVDSSCLMNLEGALLRQGSTVKTIHLAEVLASR